MHFRKNVLSFLLLIFTNLAPSASAQKIKVIVDQDARGPGTSDQQAILVFLQSENLTCLASPRSAEISG